VQKEGGAADQTGSLVKNPTYIKANARLRQKPTISGKIEVIKTALTIFKPIPISRPLHSIMAAPGAAGGVVLITAEIIHKLLKAGTLSSIAIEDIPFPFLLAMLLPTFHYEMF